MPNAIQSDYWYIDKSREFLVCEISAVSGDTVPCLGELVAYVPYVYSIDKDTNKKTLLYPSTTAVQLTSNNTSGVEIFTLVQDCSADVNFAELSKPLWAYNKESDLYNVTFLGKYAASSDGFAILSYVFQYVKDSMHFVGGKLILPENKRSGAEYNFINGRINKKYFISGNTLDSKGGIFEDFRRPPDYRLQPVHRDNDLKFNIIDLDTTGTAVTANSSIPFAFSGGFIAQRAEDIPFRTSNCIRVDFRAKSYSLDDQIGFVSTLSTDPPSATRFFSTQTLTGTPGEGFCVFFYEHLDENNNSVDVQLDGVGSSMGYSPASAMIVESGSIPFEYSGISLSGYFAVAFDIGGNFCTTLDGKPDGYADGVTFSQTVCSIGIRGSKENNYKALSQSSTITSVPFHETVSAASAATYKDFRVELTKSGKEIIVLAKEATDSTYTELHRLNMATLAGHSFTIPPKVKVGLCSTNSLSVFNFELNSFRVRGIS